MKHPRLFHSVTLQIVFLILSFLSVSLFVTAEEGTSSHFRVIHSFTGGKDGAYPYAGLVIDRAGDLFGTANQGGILNSQCAPGNTGCGTVFEITGGNSIPSFRVLYEFRGGRDGQGPYGRVAIGSEGELLGTTVGGGNTSCPGGCGAVFSLRPSAICNRCEWSESLLYRFLGGDDAYYPTGDLAFDQAGNIYGTTYLGLQAGTVYELKPKNGGWSESVLYNFSGQEGTGANPYSGVILDRPGNIYGTTLSGGINNGGTVFELAHSKSGWSLNTIFAFENGNNGESPMAGLLWEESSILIGATEAGGRGGGGTVYQLTPSQNGWNMDTLYDIPGPGGDPGPWAKLTRDAAGDLYGTTQGYPPAGDYGTVFKLIHSGGGWKEVVLHRFSGTDGEVPYGTLVLDAKGNIYGTTNLGGKYGVGVVFEVTP